MSSNRNKTSRREWLRTVGRGAGLAGLAALGVVLTAREGDACIADGACHTCRILGRCDLPEARSARRTDAKRQAGQLRERP